MIRFNTIALWVGVILISGLVSCGQDNKQERSRDVYKAPIPRLNKGGQSIDLRGWDRNAQKTLDLQDAIDVTGSGATSLEVVTQCHWGDTDPDRNITFNDPKLISIFQTLPDVLTVEDLTQPEVSCSWKLILKNSAGSVHIYDIARSVLQDKIGGEIQLENEGATLGPERASLHIDHLDKVRVRSTPPVDSTFAIHCQDAFTPSLPATPVAKMADFDFNQITLRKGRPNDILQSRFEQLCRVKIAKGDYILSQSSLFKLQFKREALIIAPLAPLHRDQPRVTNPARTLMTYVLSEKVIPMATLQLQNPSNSNRVVRFPKSALSVQIYGLIKGLIQTVTRPYVRVAPADANNATVADEGSSYRIQLAPKGTLNLQVIFQAPYMMCPGDMQPTGVAFDFPQPVVMDELGPADKVLAPIQRDLGPRALINIGKETIERGPITPVGRICNW